MSQGWDIGINKNGNVHVTGFYTLTSDFDPIGNKIDIVGNSKDDVFVASYSNEGIAKLYNFSTNKDIQCVSNNEFVFQINLPPGETINRLSWKSEEDIVGSTTPISKIYTTPGRYKISLDVVDNYGCLTSLKDTVTVGDIPISSWTIQNNKTEQCLKNNQFTFVNTSRGTYGNLTYAWNFGNGQTSSATAPIQSFELANTYSVILTSLSSTGCSSSLSNTLIVYPQPNPDFTIGYFSLCVNENEITFNAKENFHKTYSWNFGDNNSGQGSSVKHTYSSASNYTVTLEVTSENNCTEKKSDQIEILSIPSPEFNINIVEQPLLTNSFEYVFGNLSNNIICAWDLGDGTTASGTTVRHTYTQPNTYIVKLIAKNENECSATLTKTVVVTENPAFSFEINNQVQCLADNKFIFTPLPNPLPSTIQYKWSIDNSIFYSGKNSTASLTIAEAGTYVIEMELTGTGGQTVTASKTITVHPNPEVSFDILGNKDKQCLFQNAFEFNSISTLASRFFWDFGDNLPGSPAPNTSHSYINPGNYTVTLTAYSDKDCSSSKSKPVVVYENPDARFSIDNTIQPVLTNVFKLDVLNKNSNNTYTWDLGDAKIRQGDVLYYSYVAPAIYEIKLNASNSNCSSESTQVVQVVNISQISFEVKNSERQCLINNSFSFKNTSAVSDPTQVSFEWLIDDNLFYTGFEPTLPLILSQPKSYVIKLVATSNNGNKELSSKIISVEETPVAAFNIVSNLEQCLLNNEFITDNNSSISNGELTYEWEFENTTSTQKDPVIKFTQAGTYVIKLTVSSESLCSSNASIAIKVLPDPSVDFKINLDTQCANSNTYSFTAIPSSSNSNFLWNLPDGTTSTNTTTENISISTPGTYTVTLTETNPFGCSQSNTKAITVLPSPIADFTIENNNTIQCIDGNEFKFKPLTNPSISEYKWSFGDPESSLEQSPSHSYLTSGEFTVQLQVTSFDGCIGVISKNIKVEERPSAEFSTLSPTQTFNSHSFEFTPVKKEGYTHLWEFGDGNISSETVASHRYTQTGSYRVVHKITSATGCFSSYEIFVNVNTSDLISFTVEDKLIQCISSNNFIFKNTSTEEANSYAWFQNNIQFSIEKNPSPQQFTTAGIYIIKLVAYFTNKNDTVQQTIIVEDLPNARFSVNTPSYCLNTNKVTFTPVAQRSTNLQFSWSINNIITSTQTTLNYVFNEASAFQAALTLSSQSGCTNTYSENITITPNPVADFNINSTTQCSNSNTFSLTAIASSSNSDFLWSLPDGTTSTKTIIEIPPISNAGTYSITLSEKNEFGCSYSRTKQITVLPSPVANFTIVDPEQCFTNNLFKFTNASITDNSTPVEYTWKIGNDPAISIKDPQPYPFANPGSYSITLTTTYSTGNCMSSKSLTVTVKPNPSARFDINFETQCSNNNTFSFTAIPSSSNSNFLWNLPNGLTSTKTTIEDVIISNPGTYTITLTETNRTSSCQNSITKPITVLPSPIANFTIDKAQQCFTNNLYKFTNTSATDNSSPVEYTWKIGNDPSISIKDPQSYPFGSPGTYTISLTAIYSTGSCSSSNIQTVTVLPPLDLTIKVNEVRQCINENKYEFEGQSTNATSIKWDFRDFSNIEQGTRVVHTFKEAKKYVVKAIGSNAFCIDSSFSEITVLPIPDVSFSIDIPEQCEEKNRFEFRGDATTQSGGIASFLWEFGDGKTGSGKIQSYSYNQAGLFRVILKVLTTENCISSDTQFVKVIDPPQP